MGAENDLGKSLLISIEDLIKQENNKKDIEDERNLLKTKEFLIGLQRRIFETKEDIILENKIIESATKLETILTTKITEYENSRKIA